MIHFEEATSHVYYRNILIRKATNTEQLAQMASGPSAINELEFRRLSKYAAGSVRALEIGSYQGVSAARIA